MLELSRHALETTLHCLKSDVKYRVHQQCNELHYKRRYQQSLYVSVTLYSGKRTYSDTESQ